jgi:hypothetical protein
MILNRFPVFSPAPVSEPVDENAPATNASVSTWFVGAITNFGTPTIPQEVLVPQLSLCSRRPMRLAMRRPMKWGLGRELFKFMRALLAKTTSLHIGQQKMPNLNQAFVNNRLWSIRRQELAQERRRRLVKLQLISRQEGVDTLRRHTPTCL